jgi:hypothetical protein
VRANWRAREPPIGGQGHMAVIARPALVLLAAVAAVSGGCALGSGAATHAKSSAATRDTLHIVRMETYRGHGITFTYPAAWRYRNRGFYSTMTAPVVDLASQPTRNPCTPHGSWFPVHAMRPGAVAVIWEQGGDLVDPVHPPRGGIHVHVLPAGCRALAGDEEITALVVLRGGGRFEAAACLRGPNLALHEREVRAMFASARRSRP